MNTEGLARQDNGLVNFEEYAMSVDSVVHQIALIQEVQKKVMRQGEHFGVIPGCGDKPTLLKPGAEKLGFTFRLRPEFDVNTVDCPNGHREYQVKCKLYHIPTGNAVGEGVGTCTTMEGKFRYRWDNTGKPIPKEYWDTKNIDLLGGPFNAPRKVQGQWFIFQKVEHDNPADYYNCVTPDTKVLTHDLQWVPAGEIESGEMLIGVEENMTDQYARHMAIGEATVHGRKIDNLYELTFEDGRVVKCNGEHKWLVKKIGLKGTEWVSTQDIYKEVVERKGRPRNWSVMSVCAPWAEDVSKEAGYIAGLLDADGSLGSTQLGVLFAQQQNTVLALLQHGLLVRGYQLGFDSVKSNEAVEQSNSKKQVFQIRVRGGFAEQLRLLGSIRPPRLMERWLAYWDLSNRRLEGRGSGAGHPANVVSVESIGEGEVVLLGTSCKTYLAEGLVCHNTCLKMAKKRAHVDAILTATAASDIFTQDIEDMTEVIPGAKQEQAKTEPKPEAKQPQSKSAQAEGEKDLRAEITRMANEMIEEELRNDYLLDKTAWDGKDRNTGEKKHFEGKTDLTQISDAAIKVVYGKIKKDYEIWQKGQSNA